MDCEANAYRPADPGRLVSQLRPIESVVGAAVDALPGQSCEENALSGLIRV